MQRTCAVAITFALLAALTMPPANAQPMCFGRPATIVGTEGHDELDGTDGPDVIVGLDGGDLIHGGGGADRICSGHGGTYRKNGETYDETVYGDGGNDRLAGGSDYDFLYGGKGDDELRTEATGGSAVGGPGDDVLIGSDDGDTLGGIVLGGGGGTNFELTEGKGEPGNDRISAGGGNDSIIMGPGDDMVDGGEGVDQASFYSPRRKQDYSANLVTGIARGPGRDTLANLENLGAATRGDVTLVGDDGANTLVGAPSQSTGRGTFKGNGGDDLLVPWPGAELGLAGPIDIYGGAGDDEIPRNIYCQPGKPGRPTEVDGGPGYDVLATFCGNAAGGDGDDFIYGSTDTGDHALIDGGPGIDVAAWPYAGDHLEADLEAGIATTVYGDGNIGAINDLAAIEGLQGPRTVRTC